MTRAAATTPRARVRSGRCLRTATHGGNANCDTLGHPGDKYGWAVTGGFTLNDVLGLKGDQFGIQVAYSQGATGYVTRATGPWVMYSGNNAGVALTNDGVYTSGNAIELTTVWGINGFYQHYWNPRWKSSLYGGYVESDFDANAKAMYCTADGVGGTIAGRQHSGGQRCLDHSGDRRIDLQRRTTSWWQVATRTQWNPHPDLDIGLEVLYTHLNTAFNGALVSAAAGAQPSGATISDQDVVSVLFRVQRNFLP